MDLNVLAKAGYRLTPATMGQKIQRGAWIPAKHLLYIAIKIAIAVQQGNARLIITMPPRHGKSELLSINTPIWFLEKWPHKNVILSTYGSDLSTDHARKVRDMMVEGEDILTARLRADTKQVSRFMTTAGGGMRSIGVGGAITGRGGDLFLIDDYIKNAKESLSQAQRDDDWEWFRATAYTRLEPGGSMIILATRWNIDDLIGRIKTEFGDIFTEISIPAIALENDPLGRQPGEALWPERYSVEALQQIKQVLGTFWFEAQYQQRPLKSMSEVEISKHIQIIDIAPARYKLKSLRSWDFASTEDDGDWSVGLLMSRDKKEDVYYVEHVDRFQETPRGLQRRVKRCATTDGTGIKILIEQEPGSSGKIVIDTYKREVLPGYSVDGIRPTGPIEARAAPFLAACEAGKVRFVRGDWNKAFLDEIDAFPLGTHDDMISAAAQAYNRLSKGNTGVVWGENYAKPGEYRASEEHSSRIITGITW